MAYQSVLVIDKSENIEFLKVPSHPTGSGPPHLHWQRHAAVKQFWLARSMRRAFSAMAPALRNILPPKVRLAPTLLTFHKSLKTYDPMTYDPNGGTSHWSWLMN